MAIGSLTVEVAANVARFSSDMQKITKVAEDNAKKMDQAFAVVKDSIKGLAIAAGIGLTLDAIKNKIEGAIDAAAGLEKLSVRTGTAVEQLSALGAVAKLSGTDTETLAVGLQKLAKASVDAQDGGKKTSSAFNAIGISVKDLKNLSPGELFEKIGKQLEGFEDGTNKTALAQVLLGKAGAQLLPVLKDVGEAGQLVVKTTTAQAKAAEEFERNLIRIQTVFNNIYKQVAFEVLPVLNGLAEGFLKGALGADGLKGSVTELVQTHAIQDFAVEGAKFIGILADDLLLVARVVRAVGGSFESVYADIKFAGTSALPQNILEAGQKTAVGDFGSSEIGKSLANRNKVAADANQRYIDLWNTDGTKISKAINAAVAGNVAQANYAENSDPRDLLAARLKAAEEAKGKKKIPTFGENAGTVIDPNKAVLDAALKELDQYIKSEDQLLTQREQFLGIYYKQDQIGIKDYYAGRQLAIDENLKNVTAAYEAEQQAANVFILNAKNVKEQIEGGTRSDEAYAKSQLAVSAAIAKTNLNQLEAEQATKAYNDSVKQLNISLLTQQGRLDEAAKSQAELTFRKATDQAKANNDAGAQKIIDQLKAHEIAQGAINKAQSDSSLILQNLQTREGEINLAISQGNAGELAGLIEIGNARAAEIQQLQAVADAQIAIANASGDPRLVANARAFKLQIDQLAASADLLAKKFNDEFKSDFLSAFDGVIAGTKSVSQAFRDLAKNIEASLSKIATQDIADRLFGGTGSSSGKGGSLSGIGGLLSQFLSGGGGAAAGAGAVGGSALGAGGAASSGAVIDGLLSFDVGTDFVPRTGPAIVHQGERIIPASQNHSGFGSAPTINVHINGTVDQRTPGQIGAAVSRELAIHDARNN